MKIILCIIFLVPLWSFAQVSTLSKAPMKQHLKGATIQTLVSKKVLGGEKAFVGYLTIPAKGKVPEHRDSTEEYLFFIKGGGKIWINDVSYQVNPNDLVFTPAQAKVRFENGDKTSEVLQIFASPGPEKKYMNPAWKPVKN